MLHDLIINQTAATIQNLIILNGLIMQDDNEIITKNIQKEVENLIDLLKNKLNQITASRIIPAGRHT